MEDEGGGGGDEQPGDPDLDGAMIEGVDDEKVNQILEQMLQSAVTPDGQIIPDILEFLETNFPDINVAELLEGLQLEREQKAETNENPVGGDEEDDIVECLPPPSPQVPEFDVIDLECDNEVEVTLTDSPLPSPAGQSITQQASMTIIEAEGGITVCHGGGGDLRPKPILTVTTLTEVPPQDVKLPTSSIKPEPEPVPPLPVKVKKEEVPESSHRHHHHHHHKEKKKDKDRDHDREERKRRQKEKEEAREKEKEREQAQQALKSKPKVIRHPDFTKFRAKFKLLETSVTVIKIDTIMSVKKHMRLGRKRLTLVEEVDRKQQTAVNNQAGKIRLVPRPRPAFEFESVNKRHHAPEDKKSDAKKRKARVLFSDSESDGDDRKGNQGKNKGTGGKKNEKDNRKTSKSRPHGEFSATGARILPFEKPRGHQPNKETERIIKRPKMADPAEVRTKEKESRKDRGFSTGGNKETEAKLRSVLQTAIDKQKAQMQEALQFKIPKTTQPTRENPIEQCRERVSTTTPLSQIRRNDTFQFDQGRRYAPNTYGFHRQNPMTAEFGGGGAGPDTFEAYETERVNAERAIQQRLLNRPEAEDVEEEDTPLNMHDDCGSDDDEEEEPDVPLPPVEDVTIGRLARDVAELLQKQTTIQYPTMVPPTLGEGGGPRESVLTAMTIQKCAWWFSRIDKTAVPPILPIPINPELEDFPIPPPDANESVSSFGHVSNPGDRQCQINEISSTAGGRGPESDPADVADEFCGRSLLHAEFRISVDDEFQKIFDLKPGSDYDRTRLHGTCTVCKVEVNDKRALGRHVRSESHRTNFKQISLRIMPNNERRARKRDEEMVERVPRDPSKNKPSSRTGDHDRKKEKMKNGSSGGGPSKSSSSKEDSSKNTTTRKEDRKKDKVKVKKEEKVDRVSRGGTGTLERRSSTTTSRNRKSRSRSRSPLDKYTRRHRGDRERRRSRSRSPRSRSRSPLRRRRSSPRRRSTSAEKVAKFLERTRRSRSPLERKRSRRSRSGSRSPKVRLRKSRKHPSIFSEKLKLQAAGKWTNALEEKWKEMEIEEQKLEREISGLRDKLCDKPEAHPKYEGEWQAYWKQTYQEVEVSGQNPDTYDYVPGWKIQWAKRAEEMMEELHFDKLGILRNKYGMDLPSLQRLLLDIPTTPVPPPQQEVVLIPVPVRIPPSIQDIYTPFEDDLITRPMSMSSGLSLEPAPPGVGPEPVVTIDTVQKTWEMLTGQKMSGPGPSSAATRPAKSYRSATSTIGSGVEMDLDMELIEVLRLMNSLEDQLSILAPQVEEYFKRAETMELMSSGKSYDLLEDKDFVALLFQCRDKFMGLIRANILTRDVLKRMNRAVYGLTSVLDLEPCQRLRPRTVKESTTSMEVDTTTPARPTPPPDEPPPNFEIIRRPPGARMSELVSSTATAPRPLVLTDEGWERLERIQGALREFPIEKRKEVAGIIGESLAITGFPMTDTALVKYMHDVLEPALIKLNWGPTSEPVRRAPSPIPMLDGKREIMRGMGTALPVYPEVQCRAVSPPPRMIQRYFQHVRGGGGPMGGGGGPRQYLNPRGGISGGGPRGAMSPRGGRASISPQRMSPGRIFGSISPLMMTPLSPTGIIPPLIPPRGNPSPYSPRGGSPIQGVRPQGWSPRPGTPTYASPVLSHHTSPPLPGPSWSMGNNEAENTPPPPPPPTSPPLPPLPPLPVADRIRRGDSGNEETSRRDKENGTAEVFRSLDGSSVSSGSIAGSEVKGVPPAAAGDETNPTRFEVKKGSRSTLSNGSGSTRAKLKEINSQGPPPPPPLGQDLDLVSDAESGEIISSDDVSSVASSVQNRRQKLLEKMEDMKVVETQRRERKKDLEEWFDRRHRRKSGGVNSTTTTTATRRKKVTEDEDDKRSVRNGGPRKISITITTKKRCGEKRDRKLSKKRKERRRRSETPNDDGGGTEDSSRRTIKKKRRSRSRRGGRRRRESNRSESPSKGKSSKRYAPPHYRGERELPRVESREGRVQLDPLMDYHGPAPPTPFMGHRESAPPPPLKGQSAPQRLPDVSPRLGALPTRTKAHVPRAERPDDHPPPIPALDSKPPPPPEPEHSFEVVSSVCSSSSSSVGLNSPNMDGTIDISSSSDYE